MINRRTFFRGTTLGIGGLYFAPFLRQLEAAQGDKPARVLFVFPTHQVEQVLVSVPGATSGFLSEKGLSGYTSPEDRPLGDR